MEFQKTQAFIVVISQPALPPPQEVYESLVSGDPNNNILFSTGTPPPLQKCDGEGGDFQRIGPWLILS